MRKAAGTTQGPGKGPARGGPTARKGTPLERARINLTWLSRAIEDGQPLEKAIEEVYSMKIYGFAGDLRTLLKEVK